jgi:hypothetical protein
MRAPPVRWLAISYGWEFFTGCCSSVCKAIAIVTGIHNGFLGTRTVVGRLLDVKRIVAGANRPMAELRIFRPGVQSSRSFLFWPNRVVLPVLVTAACFALFLPADSALPWTRAERLVGLAIIDYAWVTYHFAAQHFGALSLYRSRAGRSRCVQTRRLDWFFALSVGGVLVFVADILAGAVAYQDQWIDRWFFPSWMVSSQDFIRNGATVVLVIVTIVMLFAEMRTARCSLPRVLYIIGIVLMVGIALRPRSLFLFLVVWTSQHWILATGLASQTPSGEPAPRHGLVRGALHKLNIRPWAVLLILIVLSVVLLPFFEVEANRQSGTYYGDRIFGAIATGLRESSWMPALVALGFATGFIHYLLDRSVYRMSDPEIRSAASALLHHSNKLNGSLRCQPRPRR